MSGSWDHYRAIIYATAKQATMASEATLLLVCAQSIQYNDYGTQFRSYCQYVSSVLIKFNFYDTNSF